MVQSEQIFVAHRRSDDYTHDSTELLDLFSARINADGRVSTKTNSLIAGIQSLDSSWGTLIVCSATAT